MNNLLVYGICAGVIVSPVFAEGKTPPEKGHPHHEKGGRGGPNGKKGPDGKKDSDEEKGPDNKSGRPSLGPPKEMFQRMDKNGDGNVTKEEFFSTPRMERLPLEKRDKLFARLDTNGDGMLGRDEIRDMRKNAEKRRKEEFRELDTDKSGGLNYAEFSEGEFFQKLPEDKRRQIFGKMDTDGNGEITPEDKPSRPDRSKRPDREK